MNVESVKGILTLPTKVWGSIALAGTAILIAEPLAVRYLGGSVLYHKYGIWIFLITVLSCSFLAIALALSIWEKVRFKRAMGNAIKFVNNTDGYERDIIRKMYNAPDHSLYLKMHAQQVIELENRFVIGKSTSQQLMYGEDQINDPSWPYFLQPWVINAINDHKIEL
jgi:hypothetical protein